MRVPWRGTGSFCVNNLNARPTERRSPQQHTRCGSDRPWGCRRPAIVWSPEWRRARVLHTGAAGDQGGWEGVGYWPTRAQVAVDEREQLRLPRGRQAGEAGWGHHPPTRRGPDRCVPALGRRRSRAGRGSRRHESRRPGRRPPCKGIEWCARRRRAKDGRKHLPKLKCVYGHCMSTAGRRSTAYPNAAAAIPLNRVTGMSTAELPTSMRCAAASSRGKAPSRLSSAARRQTRVPVGDTPGADDRVSDEKRGISG